jgi:hypothetical protein
MATAPGQPPEQPPELKAFCINLDSRPDRWVQVQEAFKPTGISLERFSAIKNDDGMRGCGASHVAVIREAQKRGLPWALIVEDDCQPAPDFGARFPAVREALWKTRGQWDVFLGGPGWIEGPVRPLADGKLYEFRKGVLLHFYVIDASAYDKAAAWNPDKHGPIDEYYSVALRKVTVEPPYLASQRPSMSNIRKTGVNYENDLRRSEEKMKSLIRLIQAGGRRRGRRRRLTRKGKGVKRRTKRSIR